MKRLPEKRQSIAPPPGVVPLLIAVVAVLTALAVVMIVVSTR